MFRSIVSEDHDERWREVLLLMVSMLDSENAEMFFVACDNVLCEVISTYDVQQLLLWATRKAALESSSHLQTTRLRYLSLALMWIIVEPLRENSRVASLDYFLDRLLDSALEIARSSDNDLANFLDIVRHRILLLARTLARTKGHTLAHVLARTLGLTFTKSTPAITTDALHFINDAQWTSLYAAAILFAKLPPQISTYQVFHETWSEQLARQKHYRHIERQFIDTLELHSVPSHNASAEEWKIFAADLRATLVHFCDIGHDWMLANDQFDRLARYLELSRRMLEWLDLAAVADRDAIRNRLLLPPQL